MQRCQVTFFLLFAQLLSGNGSRYWEIYRHMKQTHIIIKSLKSTGLSQ